MNTSKIKAIIIDDEKLAQDIVKNYLKDKNVEIVEVCNNGFEGIKAINQHKPDLVFLDIQMPKINGFEMLELLDESPTIIFTTAFDQYALKAFEVNAIDYLLKPFSSERFDEAFERAVQKIQSTGDNSSQISGLIESIDENPEKLSRIVIKSDSKINIIPVEKLNYLEAQDDYVSIVTNEGKYLKKKTMKFYEEHLDPDRFIRIHRSYIVNVDLLKQVDLIGKDSYKLTLTNGQTLPVSKSGYQNLKELIK
ncbi:MAG: LytTR family transcriptional regulator DNA-binding domain-containing protein [Bacteroidetes bacterium]|nr:LytTR family transcriptional regulator DNA-binding domain-containing protein [Bacteroidota bacterium]